MVNISRYLHRSCMLSNVDNHPNSSASATITITMTGVFNEWSNQQIQEQEEVGMRIAAGILLIIVGVALLTIFIPNMGEVVINYYVAERLPGFNLAMVVLALFFVTGGVFCLSRKYWTVCFASASLLFVLSLFAYTLFVLLWSHAAHDALGVHLAPLPVWLLQMAVGIPPAIFIYLRRNEWLESQT
jgi:hypothetical protein